MIGGEGARAEALMKEHAHVAMNSVRVLARDREEPGAAPSEMAALLASGV